MVRNQLIQKYGEIFLQSLLDPVVFSEIFLKFKPHPYQDPFLRDNSPRIVACCGRQVGKTTLSAIKALHFALSHDSVRVLVISAGLRQSIYLFDKILDLIDVCIPAQSLLTHRNRTKIRFTNGSEIVALPCGRQGYTLRGFTVDMAIIDEANYVPRVVIECVVGPMLITRPNAKRIYISTPWMKDHPFYEALTNLELGFTRYTWPTSMNPKVTKEYLEREKLLIGEHSFNREYNAMYIDDQFTYFSSDLVLNCTQNYELNKDVEQEQKYSGEYHVGLDFGKHIDHSAIAILQKIFENQVRLVYVKEFQLNTSYTDVITYLRTLHAAYNFTAGCLDQTGVGEAPYEQIREFMPQMQGITLTAPTKQDLMGKLRLAMENQKIKLPIENKHLLTQITDQQSKPLLSGTLQFTHPPGAHDDLLWALALAAQSALKPTPTFYAVSAKRN